MKWIDSKDLASWSDYPNASVELPWLVGRLVRATVSDLKRADIPFGSSVNISGWDGAVEADQGNSYVPAGRSFWEIKKSKKIKTEADKDYAKRTEETSQAEKSGSTFIFVTSRKWKTKKDWEKEKKKEGKWGDVRAYDADDLSQWIDSAPSVGPWFARDIGKIPFSGVMSLDEFWENWAGGRNSAITPSMMLAGREKSIERIAQWIREAPSRIVVKADTSDEALAFLIASLFVSENLECSAALSRSLVVNSEDAWQRLIVNNDPLLLIPRFSSAFASTPALQRGHHIYVCSPKHEDF